MKKKIIDPSTGREIWVLVDENGNIIESNVTPPEEALDEEAKKKLKDQEYEKLKMELDTVKKAYTLDTTELKKNVDTLTAMVTKLAEGITTPPPAKKVDEEEKIVYIENPETAIMNKNLVEKVTNLTKFKEEAEHKEFINAQLKAKPYLADLVKTLGVTTREQYIKIIMPLEEREEEVYRLKEQVKNNQTRDMYDEYGIGRKEKLTSAEDKILKESEEEASALFANLII